MLPIGQALVRFASLDAGKRRDLRLAAFYLMRAWLIYRRQPASDLVNRLRQSSACSTQNGSPAQLNTEQMLWSLEAAARWLPIRTDCLVQALAADLWLNAGNISRAFHLAVERPANSAAGEPEHGMSAHAWLEVDGRAVSGGRLSPDLVAFVDDGAGDVFSETDP